MKNAESDKLKLSNQLCFPLYAASRLVIREYQPLLEKLGLTYPQYLVLMILWESDGITVNEITSRLMLKTNTVTPLLKRMEKMKLISRRRSLKDERKVIIKLTSEGSALKKKAISVPSELFEKLNENILTPKDIDDLRSGLKKIIESVNRR